MPSRAANDTYRGALSKHSGAVQVALLVPLVVAIACAYGIGQFRHWADAHRTGEVLLARVGADAHKQSLELARTTSLGTVAENHNNSGLKMSLDLLQPTIDDLSDSSHDHLTALSKLPIAAEELERLEPLHESFENKLDVSIELLRSFDFTEAWIYNRERVETSFEDLRREIASVDRRLEAKAVRAGTIADIGTLVIVLLGAVTIMFLRRRVDRQRQTFQDQLAHQAYHDPLTDLANRVLLEERLGQALARASRGMAPIALLFVDLDNFKSINDALGHHGGDAFLVQFAEKLKSCTRTSDTVARVGGDEFAILLEDMSGPHDAEEIAGRVVTLLSRTVSIHNRTVVASCSVGVSVSFDGAETVEEMLGNGDVAMYTAKNTGKNRFETFSPGMRLDQFVRSEKERELRRAIDNEELVVHYQPIVDLDVDEIVGVEALVRWNHPTLGLVPPADFIPLAEETGLILPLGRWVLDQACRQVYWWQQIAPSNPLTLSVNLSATQFTQPHLVAEIATAICESGLDPSSLVLEITESTLMLDSESTVQKLEELKDIGVKLAVDDFGVGYSSLSYLRRFPVDHLKIDRSFVQSVAGGPEDAALCEAIVKLGQTLGLKTVAEGIENEDQLDWFRGKNCRYGQGFLFQRPVPAAEIDALLTASPSAWPEGHTVATPV